jgi:hypothetical protein
MRLMAAIFIQLFTGKFRKKERLLMINSYLDIKEELNMSMTTPD